MSSRCAAYLLWILAFSQCARAPGPRTSSQTSVRTRRTPPTASARSSFSPWTTRWVCVFADPWKLLWGIFLAQCCLNRPSFFKHIAWNEDVWIGLLVTNWLAVQADHQYKGHHEYDLRKTNSIVFNAFIFMQVCAFKRVLSFAAQGRLMCVC